MKTFLNSAIVLLIICVVGSCNSNQNDSKKNKLGWKLGTQAYTFREFSFFEAVDKTKELGLNYIEAYPGQEISDGIDGVINYDLDEKTRKQIKDYLDENDVEWKAFGVIVPESKKEWDSLFVFAQDMGISNIVSEPQKADLAYIAKLADKYKVNLAIHNHPKPSLYWHPDTLLNAIDGLSDRVGACADLGHFVRSGLDPVESLKKLDGRVIESHIKDVSKKDPKARDTIWGTGVINMSGILRELQKQNFKGLLSIEYEANPKDNMDQIKKSIEFFNKEASKLEKDPEEDKRAVGL